MTGSSNHLDNIASFSTFNRKLFSNPVSIFLELDLGRIMNITVNCGALLLAAVEMFNCGTRILGISCHSKNSADSLSLLKNRGSPNSSKENSC